MSEPTPSSFDPNLERRIRRRRTFRLIALTVIIFICGGAAGWGTSILLRPPRRPPLGMAAEPPVDQMVHQLRDELLLSDDQADKIQKIYKDREDALLAIRQKMEPQLKSEYDKLDEQVKGVLNPAQYKRWSERFQNVRNRMLPPPPRRPEGGPGPWRPDGGGPPDGGFPGGGFPGGGFPGGGPPGFGRRGPDGPPDQGLPDSRPDDQGRPDHGPPGHGPPDGMPPPP